MEKATIKIDKKIDDPRKSEEEYGIAKNRGEKRYLRKMLIRWKKGKISREKFIRIRKDYRS